MCSSGQIHQQLSNVSANRNKKTISLICILFLIKVFPGSYQLGGKRTLNNLPVQQTQRPLPQPLLQEVQASNQWAGRRSTHRCLWANDFTADIYWICHYSLITHCETNNVRINSIHISSVCPHHAVCRFLSQKVFKKKVQGWQFITLQHN